MNKITDEQIENILNNVYNNLKTIYDENKIIGIFTYGKVNYGFLEKIEDLKITACIAPTFEELCTKNFESKDIDINNYKIRITDARCLYEYALRQESIIMESLFSQYTKLNPKYANLFKENFYINREIIFHYDPATRIKNAVQCGYKAITDHNYFEACRLRIACDLYLSGASIENCINFKKDYHINYLYQILNNNYNKEELEEELFDDYKYFIEQSEDIEKNDAAAAIIKKGVINIIKESLNTKPDININNLFTKNEFEALRLITTKLNDYNYGNISISQLTQESDLSRPVFKNVLQKLENNNLAEVVNQGVKGTYIKLNANIL